MIYLLVFKINNTNLIVLKYDKVYIINSSTAKKYINNNN